MYYILMGQGLIVSTSGVFLLANLSKRLCMYTYILSLYLHALVLAKLCTYIYAAVLLNLIYYVKPSCSCIIDLT